MPKITVGGQKKPLYTILHGHEWQLPVEDSIQDSIYIEDLGLELVSDEIDKTRFGIITKSNLDSW